MTSAMLVLRREKKEIKMSLNFKVNSSYGNMLTIKFNEFDKISSMNSEMELFLIKNSISAEELVTQLRIYTGNKDKSYTITINESVFIVNVIKIENESQIVMNEVQQFKNNQKESVLSSTDELHRMRLLFLGEMTASLIHDINNPLGIALSGLELAEFQLDDLICDAEDEGDVSKIKKVSSRLSDVRVGISRIIEISEGIRALMYKDQISLKKQDLNKIIKNTGLFCPVFLKKSKVELKIIESVNPVFIKCKEGLLSQVLVNLIKNASDAVEGLSFHKRWIQVSTETTTKWNILRIEDGGSGIPADVQEKIFNPYFTTKDLGNGTGIGLSLCKQIIDVHGGKLEIDNNSKNTAFLIYLPLIEN